MRDHVLKKKNYIIDTQYKFNHPLFENMLKFIDIVMEINVRMATFTIIGNKIDESLNGYVGDYEENLDKIIQERAVGTNGSSLRAAVGLEHLRGLKEEEIYEIHMREKGQVVLYQIVVTPVFDVLNNLNCVYLSASNIQVKEDKLNLERQQQELKGLNSILTEASKVLAIRYEKVLKIDIKNDSYNEIRVNAAEKLERIHSYKFSEWVSKYISDGNVYEGDVDKFCEFLDMERNCKLFESGERRKSLRYRRYNGNNIRWVTLELAKGLEYTPERPSMILFVVDSEENRLIEGMSRAYYDVYYIDMNTHNYTEIHTYEHTRKGRKLLAGVSAFGNADVDFSKMINAIVKQQFREELVEFLELDTMNERLKDTNMLSIDFQGIEFGWSQGALIVADRDVEGNVTAVLWAVRDIDKEKSRELNAVKRLRGSIESERGEYKTLLSVASIYNTMHLLDIENDKVKELSSTLDISRYIRVHKSLGMQELIWRMVKKYICEAQEAEAIKFTDCSTLNERLKNRTDISMEMLNVENRWIRLAFIKAGENESGITKVLIVTQDIDESKRKEENLVFMSNTDELTGVYNRHAYEQDILHIEKNGIGDDLWFIGFDLNGLKRVNDVKGHSAGDELIIAMSDCIKDAISKYGKVYRVGGDEFTAILRCTDIEMKDILCDMEKKRQAWHGKFSDEVSFSKGVVNSGELAGCSIAELEREADRRMYGEKKEYYSKGPDRRNRK